MNPDRENSAGDFLSDAALYGGRAAGRADRLHQPGRESAPT